MRKLYNYHKEKINYLLAGIWNTAFGYLLFTLLYLLFGSRIHYVLLLIVSTVCSITNAYISYKFYVFRTKGNYFKEYLRFYAVYGVSFLLNLVLLPMIVEIFKVSPVIVQAYVVGFTFLASYFGHKYFSFSGGGEERARISSIVANILSNKIFWLVIITFTAHGLILIMDGLYWDDWLWFFDLISGQGDKMVELSKQMGSIFAGSGYFQILLYKIFGGNILFGWHLVALMSILFSGILIYQISRKVGYFSDLESFWLGAVVISCPAFQIAFIGSVTLYLFCLFAFLLGVYLSLEKVERGLQPVIGVFWRLLSLLMFFVSFYTNSILVFFYGFLLLWYLYENEEILSFDSAKIYLIRKVDYIILPFVYFSVKLFFFPTYGLYAGYNVVSLSIKIFAIAFAKNSILVVNPLRLFSGNIAANMLFAFVILLVFVYLFCISKKRERGALLFGMLLFFLAIFPYAAVGLLGGGGYESRHLLLTGIPFSILLITSYKIICDRRHSLSKLLNAFLILIIVMFSLRLIKTYADWQYYAIKDRAIEKQLILMGNAKSYSIFFIDDKSASKYGRRSYRFYEWSSMFRHIWGDTRWVGFDIDRKKGLKKAFETCKSYNFDRCDINGKRALIEIVDAGVSRKPAFLQKYRDVARYYLYLLTDKNKYNELIKNDIISIKITPLN